MEIKKTKIQKLVEKEEGDYHSAAKIAAKDYLGKHLKYQKKKYMDLNVMTLHILLAEFYYAGVQAGIDKMAENLKIYDRECD